MKFDRLLRSLTELIVRSCDPEEVVLFGSVAKNAQRADSDLDLLVIGHFRERADLRASELRGRLSEFPLRIDLILATPEELRKRTCAPDNFFRCVLTHGRTLYRRCGSFHTGTPEPEKSTEKCCLSRNEAS